tara:strand:- start:319 stop:810 length:492 start_codon:yes stop_codon:yes gene_type:complete
MKPHFKKTFQKVLGKAEIPSYKDVLSKAEYQPMRDKLLKMKNKQFGLQMLTVISMLGLTPQVLNIYLTKKRDQAQMAALKAQIEKNQQEQAPESQIQKVEESMPATTPLQSPQAVQDLQPAMAFQPENYYFVPQNTPYGVYTPLRRNPNSPFYAFRATQQRMF